MCQVKATGWAIGVVVGVSIGFLLPPVINAIAALAIAIFIAKLFLKMSVIEVEEEHFI